MQFFKGWEQNNCKVYFHFLKISKAFKMEMTKEHMYFNLCSSLKRGQWTGTLLYEFYFHSRHINVFIFGMNWHFQQFSLGSWGEKLFELMNSCSEWVPGASHLAAKDKQLISGLLTSGSGARMGIDVCRRRVQPQWQTSTGIIGYETQSFVSS